MIIIRAVALLLHFTIVPFAIGRLITYRARKGILVDYLVGFFGNLGIFYILYSIITWMQMWVTMEVAVKGGFTMLLNTYFVVAAALVIAWIFLERNTLKKAVPKSKARATAVAGCVKKSKLTPVYAFAFAILMLIQMYMAYGYEVNEWSYDDYDYVVVSQDTIDYDALSYVNVIDGSVPNTQEKRIVCSWYSYVAMLAKVSSFEVTTVAHTILPVLLLLVAYMVYYYMARFLFGNTQDRLIFMIILTFTYIFGLYSHYSVTFRLLGALWQGKAVLTVIAVPFLAVYLFRAYNEDYQTGRLLPIAAISLGATSLTSLSIMFLPIMVIVIWVMHCVCKRKLGGFRYLLASLFGPIYLGVFYGLMWMLLQDMWNLREDQFFPFRRKHEWWYKWFKKDI